VTDDTSQALIVADLTITGQGMVDEWALAQRLADWEDEMIKRGSADLLGPSTRRALDALAAGFGPEAAGRTGTTNGAAMRIAPVGIAVPPGPALYVAVERAARLTHNTSIAMSGAFAVAAAVSTGMAGGSMGEALEAAISASESGASRGQPSQAPALAPRLATVARDVWGRTPSAIFHYVAEVTGTSLATEESVPAAFAFALAAGSEPWMAVRMAASAGGDTDTIAAMTGALLGACYGREVFPDHAVAMVEQRNGLDLLTVGARLAAVRAAREDRP
jgi:ADP-ribosylglycohydrolase